MGWGKKFRRAAKAAVKAAVATTSPVTASKALFSLNPQTAIDRTYEYAVGGELGAMGARGGLAALTELGPSEQAEAEIEMPDSADAELKARRKAAEELSKRQKAQPGRKQTILTQRSSSRSLLTG